MKEEKIQELLDYLSRIGFRGAQLDTDIRQQIKSEKFEFSVTQELSFDNEKIFFTINLQRDQQFNAYRLTAYTAYHQAPPDGKESVRKFSVTRSGICNVNLAFNIVSGKFDDLMGK
ncbi:hypothetical protein [Niabella hirudinis]|uniref:hypothetical protein n=1 Tax=Niabella hirudinis TaxID=1285929 RepID=UPI003EBF8E37